MPESQPPLQRPTLRRIWQALRSHTPDERPAGVPKLAYRFPLGWLIGMGRDMLFSRPRSFRADCALAVRSLPRVPIVDGLEHVPPAGSFVLVANHYQRRDLWIGWAGGLLCDALWMARPDLSCHLVTTDRAVLDGASVRWTRPVFERVARVWDAILVTPPEARDADAAHTRRQTLRRCLTKLRPADGHSVCLVVLPEGLRGSTRGLRMAAPGSGRSLLALAASGVPLLPAAVWEEPGGALHGRFGPAWHPTAPPDVSRDALDLMAGADVMTRIAALMPEALRGEYGRQPDTNACSTTCVETG